MNLECNAWSYEFIFTKPNPTQIFWQNHKNPKTNSQKHENLGLNAWKMHEEWEKERLRALTKEFELGLGRKWRGKKVFGEKKGFWVERKEREIEIFDFTQNRVGPQSIYRKRNLIDQGGFELLLRPKAR